MKSVICHFLFLILALLPASALAQRQPYRPEPGTVTRAVGFDQHLGQKVPLDLTLRDEAGREVRLAEYFGQRPVILTLVYYRCPMLCGQVLQGLARSIKPLTMTPGQGFEIVTVSIDPTEGPDLASKKKATYIDHYGRPQAASGWHFLTTPDQDAIDRLATAVGFRYTYNPESRQFAHAAGFTLLTPDGTISQYFFGIDIPPRNLKDALDAAGARKVGSPIASLLLLCYDYDPATGKYTLTVMSVLRAFGVLTLLGMTTLIVTLLVRERLGRSCRRDPEGEPEAAATLEARNP